MATIEEISIISENWNNMPVFDRLLTLALAAIAQNVVDVNPAITSDRLGAMAALSWDGLHFEEREWVIASCGFLP